MKKLQITLMALALVLLSVGAHSQSKPIRIGVKMGLPNVATVNLEYVLPVLGKKLGISADFLALSPKVADAEVDFSYWEIGANYYPLAEGKWLYVGVGYGGFNSDIKITNIEGDQDPSLTDGEASTSYNFSSFNLKIGAKIGGLFYIRPEVGYGLGARDETITTTVEFPNGASETQTLDVPGWASSGLIANFGFGFSF